jgi:hypothetical protein
MLIGTARMKFKKLEKYRSTRTKLDLENIPEQ